MPPSDLRSPADRSLDRGVEHSRQPTDIGRIVGAAPTPPPTPRRATGGTGRFEQWGLSGGARAFAREPTRGWRWTRCAAILVLSALGAVTGTAGAESTAKQSGPADAHWALEVASASQTTRDLRATLLLRSRGIDTLLVDPQTLSPAHVGRLARIARQANISVVLEEPRAKVAQDGGEAACRIASRRLALPPTSTSCAFRADSPTAALALARQLKPSVTVYVRLRRASSVRFLRSASAHHARILAVVPFSRPRRATARATASSSLLRAVEIAARSPAIDLALAASPGSAQAREARLFASLVASTTIRPPTAGGAPPSAPPAPPPSPPVGQPLDATAPTTPGSLSVTTQTTNSITVAWAASRDDAGVVAYDVSNGQVAAGSTTATSFTLTGLSCGSAYLISVTARDAAGNSSAATMSRATTSACATPVGPGDSTPPTAPSNLQVTASAATSLTLSWDASSDNVGVAGYDTHLNSTRVGSASSTTYTFTGLTCGTSYTLGVSASDTAGNSSSRSTISSTTPPCVAPGQLYVATNGSDAANNNCASAAKPCLTLNYAYQQATQGDTIQMACGAYPGQTIAYDSSKNSDTQYITITSASPGARCAKIGAQAMLTSGVAQSATSFTVDDASNFKTGQAISVGAWSSVTCTTTTSTRFSGCSGDSSPGWDYTAGGQIYQGGLTISGSTYLKVTGLTITNLPLVTRATSARATSTLKTTRSRSSTSATRITRPSRATRSDRSRWSGPPIYRPETDTETRISPSPATSSTTSTAPTVTTPVAARTWSAYSSPTRMG